MMACVAVMIETGVALFIVELGPLTALVLLWTVSATGESWIQFDSWRHRILWILAGLLTGCCLYLQVRDPPHPFAPFVLFVPALIECLTARRIRRRAWIWLIATPAIYWLWRAWSNEGYDLGSRIVEVFASTIGFGANVPSRIPGIAAVLGLPLILRAILGAFAAPRKVE
jgi:hypothetical protein